MEGFLSDDLNLRLNDAATRIRPVSCGMNFLGYVVHPDHRLTRRRVAGNFSARLEQYRERLVSCGRDGTVYRFDEAALEGLLGTDNSYLAHMAKASSHRLTGAILQDHAWLTQYFTIKGNKAARTWKPPRSFRSLRRQWKWFARNWPGAVVFLQVGSHFELYGRDAQWALKALDLAGQRPRFGGVSRVGFPVRMLASYVPATTAAGRCSLIVRETGYPLGLVKERQPEEYHGQLLPAVRVGLPARTCASKLQRSSMPAVRAAGRDASGTGCRQGCQRYGMPARCQRYGMPARTCAS